MKRHILLLVSVLVIPWLAVAQPLVLQLADEPTIPATNARQGIINCHQLDVKFDKGNGESRIIVMRANAPVDQLPQDGQSYFDNTTFGVGNDLGNGNFVVWKGSGNSVTITGLKENTDYHYAIFEYNGTGSNADYLTSIYLSVNKFFPKDPTVEVEARDVSCYGDKDGAIQLDVSDGTAPYKFKWNTGSDQSGISGLAPGRYSFTVTDSVGCRIIKTVEVYEPDSLSLSFEKQDITCPGGSDGQATVVVDGGTGAYSYEWSNGADEATATGLEAGNYSVTVTDENGCSKTAEVTLTQPPSFAKEQSITNVSCHGGADGQVQIFPAGGNAPYEIAWNTEQTTFSIENLEAGMYSYTVTDANGCSFTGELNVSEPEPINMEATIYDVSCFGANDGSIALTVDGGTVPYTFEWSDGATGGVRNELEPGDYNVTLTDENGCTESLNLAIYEPDSLAVAMEVKNVTCSEKTDGFIKLEVSGGLEPYNFEWNDGASEKDRLYLSTGDYSVTVTDQNGCEVTTGTRITVPASDQQDCQIEVNIFDVFTPNGDGDNETFVIENIQEFPNNQLEIYNRWGLLVYSTSGYQNNWKGTNQGGERLPAGAYYYVLKIFTTTTATFTGSITFLR